MTKKLIFIAKLKSDPRWWWKAERKRLQAEVRLLREISVTLREKGSEEGMRELLGM
jgi:hypothetical protein